MAPTETRRSIRWKLDSPNKSEENKYTHKSSNYLRDKMYRRKGFEEVDQKFERLNHLEMQLRSLRKEQQESIEERNDTLMPLHPENDAHENAETIDRIRRLGDHGAHNSDSLLGKDNLQPHSFMTNIFENLKTIKWDALRSRMAGLNWTTVYSLPPWTLRLIALIACMGFPGICIEVYLEQTSKTSLLSVFSSPHRQAMIKRMESLSQKVRNLKIVTSKMQTQSVRIFEDAKNHLIRMKSDREQYQQAIKLQMQELRRYMLEMQQVVQSENYHVNVTNNVNDTIVKVNVRNAPPSNHSEKRNAFVSRNISALHTAADHTSQLASDNGFISSAFLWKFLAVFLTIFVVGGGVALRVRYLINRRNVRARQYRLRRQSKSSQRKVKTSSHRSDAAIGHFARPPHEGNNERYDSEYSRGTAHTIDRNPLPRVSAQV